ncbi:MAG: hypothetical protein KatS3mg016_1584 [Fimbriimonadales bacterium]|nr:MAG: hypothetical protein KatS3mg016_1584 [Fimbriimonadales bacterium]
MKRKLLWLVAIGAVAALAYAQTVTVRGAMGHGMAGAPEAERPNAQFRFVAKQVVFNDQSRTGGSFEIEVRGENALTVVHLPTVNRLEVDAENGVAGFSGRGWIAQRTRQGVRRVPGIVSVRVADNREADSTDGDPDTIAVAFRTTPDAEPAFTYRGVVKRGDIRVFEETRSR